METKKMASWAILVLVLIVGGIAGCLSFTNDGVDFISISEMSEEEFEIFKSDMSLLTMIVAKDKMQDNPELQEKVREFVRYGQSLVQERGLDLATFTQALVEGIDDLTLRAVLELAINRIKLRGGFTYVEEGGELYLTERGVELVSALLSGLENALPE